MTESLCDGLTTAVVLFGLFAVVVWRRTETHTDSKAPPNAMRIVGFVAAGLSVSLLVLRWGQAIASLPESHRPGLVTAVLILLSCGATAGIALSWFLTPSKTHPTWWLGTLTICVAIAVSLIAGWKWALLVLSLGATLFGLLKSQTTSHTHADEMQLSEPGLAAALTVMLTLLLLGTWSHVFDRELQRKTRSPRHSAWPRVTALRDAWQRTGWVATPGDRDSANEVTSRAAHEQRIAWGLGALMMVVAAASWPVSRRAPVELTEVPDAN